MQCEGVLPIFREVQSAPSASTRRAGRGDSVESQSAVASHGGRCAVWRLDGGLEAGSSAISRLAASPLLKS